MSNLLPCVEIGSSDSTHSIIWLHGLGADGHDFEPIVPELKLNIPIRFIFPHAPEMPVTINNGMVMPAWYDIQSPQIETLPDEKGVRSSQQRILALIDREIERGIESHHIILAGFSQGGAIALQTGLSFEKPLAGIMGLSTYLVLPDTIQNERHEANKKTPIFLAHGKYDPIVPAQLANQTQTILQQSGYSTKLNLYEMEHSVCQEEVDAISNWIKIIFS